MNSLARICMVGACLSISLLALTGCTDTKAAVAFNDQIVNALKRMKPINDQFGNELQSAILQGRPDQVKQLRATQKSAQAALEGIRNEAKTWKMPEKASAKAVFASYEKYMIVLEDLANKDFNDIIGTLESKDSMLKKAQRIEQILKQLDAREQNAVMEFKNAQTVFARDYNFKIQ